LSKPVAADRSGREGPAWLIERVTELLDETRDAEACREKRMVMQMD
jgi:hypothetical protein